MLSFYLKFWTDRRRDRQMDIHTSVKQYAPDLLMWVQKKKKKKSNHLNFPKNVFFLQFL